MTSKTSFLLTGLILLAALFSTGSCVNSIDDDGEEAISTQLRISTRGNGSGSSLSYPIRLYAFDAAAKLQASTTLNSAADNSVLTLTDGTYHLVALSGTAECILPTSGITRQSTISLPAAGYTTGEALQMGCADVTVKGGKATVDIRLTYRVACLDLKLIDLPETTAAASISLSMLYGTMDFTGTYGEEGKTVTVACNKQKDGSWKTPTFFTLPGSGNALTLSITLTDNGKTETYGYTYTGKLEAGTPYALVGSYKEGFSVDENITIEGWGKQKDIDFNFGKDTGDSGSGEGGSGSGSGDEGGGSGSDVAPNADGSYTVTVLPTAQSIWNGHFVVAVQNATASGAELLLLSLHDWTDVSSASSTKENKIEAADAVATYIEGKMTSWNIPSKDEAKVIQKACGGTALAAANSLLSTAGGDALMGDEEDSHGEKVRYLCEGAESSYSLKATSSNITLAGPSRMYNLRAVRKVKVVIE